MKERAPYCCEPIKHLVGTDGVLFCKRVTAICWESAVTYRPPWPAVCVALPTVTGAKSSMVAVGESLTLPPALFPTLGQTGIPELNLDILRRNPNVAILFATISPRNI